MQPFVQTRPFTGTLVCLLAIFSVVRSAPAAAQDDPDAAFEALKKQFEAEREKDAFERIETIEKFGDVKSDKVVPFLARALPQEENAGIAGAIVRSLGKFGNEEAVKAIVTRGVPPLIASYEGVSAFEGIGRYSLEQALFSGTLDDDAEDWLVKNGLTPTVRGHAGVYRVILTAIANTDHRRRLSVINAELRRAASPGAQVAVLNVFRDQRLDAAVPTAAKLMTSRIPEVQVAALEVLLVNEAKKYKTRYLSLLRSKDWKVQTIAVDLIAMCGDTKLTKRLLPLLESQNATVKIATVAALVELGGPDVIMPLILALERSEGRVQDDIADALARLTGVDLGANSAQWESWWATYKDKVEVRRRTLQEFISIKSAENEKDADKRTLLYHGLRVQSKHCAFVIDCSESMREEYEFKPDRPGAENGPRGKTVVKRPAKKKGEGGADADANTRAKIEVAKSELKKVLTRLPDGVAVNVVRFNTLVDSWRPYLEKLNTALRLDATRFVDASTPAGLTNLFDAIERTFADEKVDTIFLLSDGAPTTGKYLETTKILDQVRDMNRFRKIKINTIGFNLKPEERQLLELLADQNFGVFMAR